jgi:lauroyl/myristoyl acyltransferase
MILGADSEPTPQFDKRISDTYFAIALEGSRRMPNPIVLLLLAPVALLLPQRFWVAYGYGLTRLRLLRPPRYLRERIDQMPAFMLELTGWPARTIAAYTEALILVQWLQILRMIFRKRWQPRVELVGREHIDAALAAGKGAVLWISHSASSDIASKIAFYNAGFRVSHLSRPLHGFEVTGPGSNFARRLWTNVEDRFIAERLSIDDEHSLAALRTLRQRLSENRVVTITAIAQGRRVHMTPVFGGSLPVAAGAPHLAHWAGAPLLPVFCVEDRGVYRVMVEEPLPVPASVSREEAELAATRAYGAALERFVEKHASMWLRYVRWLPIDPSGLAVANEGAAAANTTTEAD